VPKTKKYKGGLNKLHIGNDIKVLLTKYSKDVIIDDIGGELLLYNHSNLDPFTERGILKEFIFTGISFDPLPEVISFQVCDLYEDPLEYMIYKKYFFVKYYTGIDLNDPICVVGFKPKTDHWICKRFYAHFIEKI
jgi:hypothetical protein